MNPHDSGRFCTESLVSAAKRYKTLGFSLIPLNGARFPRRAKQPAIRWARYQHTPPTDEDLHNWFVEQQYAGLGAVCGRVSRLAVLDFDDSQEASEFRRLMPELAQTYTVRSGTRGLPHFYYRLSEGQLISTQSFGKVDLRGEGSYVVAPPTVVGKACWLVEFDAEIKLLADVDLRRLLTYLRGVAERIQAEASEFRHLGVEGVYLQGLPAQDLSPSNPYGWGEASEFRRLGANDLVAGYHQSVLLGRNHALFKTACMARDGGWLEQQVVALLAGVHARQAGGTDEPFDGRYAEAVRTIGSVYSRPARVVVSMTSSPVSNALREWLLAHDMAAAARMLDGLCMVGMQAGDLFTERQACEALAQYGIGRRSVMAALDAVYAPGCWLFETASFPPLNPPIRANAASDADGLNNSCEMSRGAKRVKCAEMGRKPRLYRLPDAKLVAEKLGLKAGGGDALEPEDLASPRAYRQALHRLLFERRPGQYARRWLAARLGVSRWTTRRYERAAQVYCQPVYATHALDWHTAQSMLPEVERDAGQFIEDAAGKRYPALQAVAFKLLKAGRQVFLRRQEANYFAAKAASVGIPTLQPSRRDLTLANPTPANLVNKQPQHPSVGIPTLQPSRGDLTLANPCPANPRNHQPQTASVRIPTPQPERRAFWLCPACLDHHISQRPPDVCRCGQQAAWEEVPEDIWRDTERVKAWWQTRWHEHQQAQGRGQAITLTPSKRPAHLSDPAAEACARRLPEQVKNLSLATARKLIVRYGLAAVERGLQALKARANIHNPAGFLVSLLRSEHKFQNTAGREPAHHRVSNHSDWVRNMGQSAYLAFVANADEFAVAGV